MVQLGSKNANCEKLARQCRWSYIHIITVVGFECVCVCVIQPQTVKRVYYYVI